MFVQLRNESGWGPFSWQQTQQQQQYVSSPKAIAFSRAARLFIELCPLSGLEKKVKVTALQKDNYLPFSLLNGLKCSWDNEFQAWNPDCLALSRAGGKQGMDAQEKNWATGTSLVGKARGDHGLTTHCRSSAMRPAGFWQSQICFVKPPKCSQLLSISFLILLFFFFSCFFFLLFSLVTNWWIMNASLLCHYLNFLCCY